MILYDIYNNFYKFILFSVFLSLTLYYFIYNNKFLNISNKFPILSIFIFLLINFIFFISYYFFKTKTNKNIFSAETEYIKQYSKYLNYLFNVSLIFLFPLAVVIVIALFLYFISNISQIKNIIDNLFKYSLVFGTIYLLYKNKDYIKKLLNLEFDFKTFLETINKTSNKLTIILVLSLFIISFCLPYIIKLITTYDGHIIIDKPVYLNNKYVTGDAKFLYKIKPRNYNYSLSLWFWLNPQPSNTSYAYQKFTNIMTFDKKPAIEYNGSNNTLRVIFDNTDKEHTIFSTKDVLYQKWNNLVINYSEGNVDVFLNSELIGSKSSISPFYKYSFIDIGEKKGIHGGISNVVFYNRPLTLTNIKLNYNYFKNLYEPYI